MSTRKTIEQEKQEKLQFEYKRLYYKDADLSFLENVPIACRKKDTVNDIIITFDTETSKSKKNTFFIQKKKGKEYKRINPVNNYVVAWTISIGTMTHDLMTIYGNRPSEFIETVKSIIYHLQGNQTLLYAHNLAYDYTFLRRFLFDAFGYPVQQLNTKAHYPISIEFANGLTLKDSLILAQRSLDKWAKDLDVVNKKAVGFWDYDMIRFQDYTFSLDELIYIENDTLALLQCLRKMCEALNKHIYTLPYTATGIVREKIKRAGLEHFGNDLFKKCVPTFDIYQILTKCFHGGFTHANENYSCITQIGLTECFDFASSYPFVLLTEKFPVDAYRPIEIRDYNTILDRADNYSFIFEVTLLDVHLKKYVEMPFLQYSKTTNTVNQIMDNGRITHADMVSIYMTEVDFEIICEQYDFNKDFVIIENCYMAEKDYLPKWFTDEIYQLFIDKTKLKGVDKVRYQIAKGMLNSCYGMCAQRSVRDNIIENYETGDFETQDTDLLAEYEKYTKKKTNVLPYQWGVYVTAYATRNLFKLGKCFEYWLYSDTDSCYGQNPDLKAIDEYNESCKAKLIDRGYGAVMHNNREYWLGVAEQDGDEDKYTEFKTLGAKRYVGRCLADGQLHLTVSGVPKRAVEQLDDNILNFTRGFIFKGEQSGKLTHFYQMSDKIYIDDNGNECADSIDLCPCDYELSDPYHLDLDELLTIEIGVVEYEDE